MAEATLTKLAMAEVALEDVRRAAPAEASDEQAVMDFIERSDVTGRSSKFFDAATSIPSEVASQTSSRTELFQDTHSNDHSEENKDVDDELFAITNSINRMHYEMHAAHAASQEANDSGVGEKVKDKRKSKMEFPGQVYRGNEGAPQSQGDKFAANAGHIFHGYSKKKRGFFRRKKKTSSRKKVDGDDDSDVESASSGRHQSNLYAKKMKIASLESLQEFKSVVIDKKGYVWSYIRDALFFIVIPSTLLAAILFYFLGNPEFGDSLSFDDVALYFNSQTESPSSISGEPTPAPSMAGLEFGFDPSKCHYWKGVKGPTLSWWLLFLGVRQVITLGFARAAQYVVIYYALKINFSGLMGPTIRLFLLQAKGWPFVMILWALFNFALLFGNRRFSGHWAFWQDWVELFNACNPSGSVTSNSNYGGLLVYAIFLGVLVAVKRFWLGLRFGKASYVRYADKLSDILKDLLLLSRVAKVSKYDYYSEMNPRDMDDHSVLDFWYTASGEPDNASDGLSLPPLDNGSAHGGEKKKPHRRTYTAMTVESANFLTEKQNEDIRELLGEWEDIELSDGNAEEADLTSIIQFRASIGVLESAMPYSPAFGMARTRKEVIEGSERLYDALVKKQQYMESDFISSHAPTTLRFHTVALTALKSSGYFDEKQCKSLVKLFRPGRDGSLTKLEFCKSIDNQYKELRKLRASIVNEGKVNIASERIINFVFYGIMVVILLGILGIDPIALFGVLTSFILGFSFMISGASSDYFRGLLFVTLQRPYDIGDRVNVSSAISESSAGGAAGWIVKDVNLYHTTFIFGTTNEYATISNGALSNARIINAARSPRALMNFAMKFGLAVPESTIMSFKEDLIAYVKARPREFMSFAAFRMTRIEADHGFIEYKIVVLLRESWQQVGALLNSLAALQAFAFARSQELNMVYRAPCMPIELKMIGDDDAPGTTPNPLNQNPDLPRPNRNRAATESGVPSSPFRNALFGR
ncbi:unnamed protein product [Cylindrotheca closterium]|uniref:Mechanosensitive ion channel MscS domain-containing protein n=1 Tax=Cylindrotheca closterium TaxID=2856 RepID=A0AAD2JNU5_9STRA|nr:unnamed protein product [Cylindrotheca closterium]